MPRKKMVKPPTTGSSDLSASEAEQQFLAAAAAAVVEKQTKASSEQQQQTKNKIKKKKKKKKKNSKMNGDDDEDDEDGEMNINNLNGGGSVLQQNAATFGALMGTANGANVGGLLSSTSLPLSPKRRRALRRSKQMAKNFGTREIVVVQSLIERCLTMYATKEEVFHTLQHRCGIDSEITSAVWKKLERENEEFFKEYYERLKLKGRIEEFNECVAKYAENVGILPAEDNTEGNKKTKEYDEDNEEADENTTSTNTTTIKSKGGGKVGKKKKKNGTAKKNQDFPEPKKLQLT